MKETYKKMNDNVNNVYIHKTLKKCISDVTDIFASVLSGESISIHEVRSENSIFIEPSWIDHNGERDKEGSYTHLKVKLCEIC